MAEYVLKYADAHGHIQQQVETAESEAEVRARYGEKGLLVYSVRPHRSLMEFNLGDLRPKGKRLNLEQFVIFNQQFVTLAKAGLPIIKSLDLLVGNTKNPRLKEHLEQIRDDVKTGIPLSDAFRARGVFPPIYTTSLMAGEKSGSLPEVIDRYVQYQKLALSVRKKILVSLIYPCVLVTLVLALVVFLVTYVVPEFAALYESMDASLPGMTQILVSFGVTISENLLAIAASLVLLGSLLFWWLRTEAMQNQLDRIKIRIPLFGQIWIKFQVSQLCRLLSTLLAGGIPLVQALETTGQSLGSRMIREAVSSSKALVQEGRSLSQGMREAKIFPSLAIEMIQVGESTGALPAMMTSVAEFFDEEVSTRMAAVLSLIEPAIMIFMGTFVAFVLISLYLPIFTLAEGL